MSWWEELIRGLAAVPTGGLSEVIGRRHGILGTIGKPVTGGLEGAAGGFVTGGPVGAVMGGGTGLGLSASGATDPYTLKGGGINVGSGMGAGGLTHLPAMMASSSSAGGASGPSPISLALQSMRGSPPSQTSAQNPLARIYQMFPSLRPGAPLGQPMNMGGF
jgi:hypothetical protein